MTTAKAVEPRTRLLALTGTMAVSFLIVWLVIKAIIAIGGGTRPEEQSIAYAVTLLVMQFVVLPLTWKGQAVWMRNTGHIPRSLSFGWIILAWMLNVVIAVSVWLWVIPSSIAPAIAYLICLAEFFGVMRVESAESSDVRHD